MSAPNFAGSLRIAKLNKSAATIDIISCSFAFLVSFSKQLIFC